MGLVSGLVVRGVVIDAAAIAAGTALAVKATVVAEQLLEKYPENFMVKSGMLMGGRKYIVVTGGLEEPLKLIDTPKRKIKKLLSEPAKSPMKVCSGSSKNIVTENVVEDVKIVSENVGEVKIVSENLEN